MRSVRNCCLWSTRSTSYGPRQSRKKRRTESGKSRYTGYMGGWLRWRTSSMDWKEEGTLSGCSVTGQVGEGQDPRQHEHYSKALDELFQSLA